MNHTVLLLHSKPHTISDTVAEHFGGEPDRVPLDAKMRRLAADVTQAFIRAPEDDYFRKLKQVYLVTDGPVDTSHRPQLVPVDGGWLVRVLSDKGQALVTDAASWSEASEHDMKRVSALEAEVSAQMTRGPIQHEWSQVLEAGFQDPSWDRLAEHCLGCSICAYVCPSCSCFDMNHEANAWCGEQCRSWDACTFGLFTHHASGHNPRSTRQ